MLEAALEVWVESALGERRKPVQMGSSNSVRLPMASGSVARRPVDSPLFLLAAPALSQPPKRLQSTLTALGTVSHGVPSLELLRPQVS